jgi:energy-coupling factor transporter ATP-binding protein EcfA2
MFTSITLRFGSNEGQPLTFEPGSMTVFVGPNNSGKSLILRDLESIGHSGGVGQAMGTIVDRVGVKQMTEEDFKRMFIDETHLLAPTIKVNKVTGGINISDPMRGTGTGWDNLLRRPEMYKANLEGISRALIVNSTVRLDGHTRLTLLTPIKVTDLQQPAIGVLGALFRNEVARQRLRELTYEAFGSYFTIDPSAMTQFRARMSDELPQGQEHSLTDGAVEFFRRAPEITQFSDGVRAYTGLLAAVLCSQYLVMLIDEPDAFLHPPLVRKLGRRLTEIASERGGNVLASTHSADFLMGCVQAGKSVNVVRLTYKQGIPTARLLEAAKLEEMMRNPFLRSSGVLSVLFHEGAVICEADTDRAFYHEINERLVEFSKDGSDSCVFLNSNGKDTLRSLLQPLRAMGIPAATIVDLDVIKPGTLKLLMEAAFIPPPLVKTFNELRAQIYSVFQDNNLEPKRVGIAALDKTNKEVATTLINSLYEYGIFIVPTGELEKWLSELQAVGHGPYWLSQIFTKMGTDPKNTNYLKPTEEDVWDFIRKVAIWIANPGRKGMPE